MIVYSDNGDNQHKLKKGDCEIHRVQRPLAALWHPQRTPGSSLTWGGVPRRAYTAMVDGKVVATVRNYRRGWIARILGWVWKLPARTGKESEAGAFSTATAAKKAVGSAYKQMLEMEC